MAKLWSLASIRSVSRGYDYYLNGVVTSYEPVGQNLFESYIQGSADEPYHTVIDLDHPKRSKCTCPFAEGRHVICKHMVALQFTIFPSEAEAFMHEVEEGEKEEARRVQEHREQLERYVMSLKKDELQRRLLSALIELEERDYRYW